MDCPLLCELQTTCKVNGDIKMKEDFIFVLALLYYGCGIILQIVKALKMRKESVKEKDLLKQVSPKSVIS